MCVVIPCVNMWFGVRCLIIKKKNFRREYSKILRTYLYIIQKIFLIKNHHPNIYVDGIRSLMYSSKQVFNNSLCVILRENYNMYSPPHYYLIYKMNKPPTNFLRQSIYGTSWKQTMHNIIFKNIIKIHIHINDTSKYSF